MFTIYCACRKIFYTWVFAAFRLATEVSILFFLAMGLYCQIQYGKISSEEYFSIENESWYHVQYACLGVVFFCCFCMFLSLIASVVIALKDRRRLKALKAKTEAEEQRQ